MALRVVAVPLLVLEDVELEPLEGVELAAGAELVAGELGVLLDELVVCEWVEP